MWTFLFCQPDMGQQGQGGGLEHKSTQRSNMINEISLFHDLSFTLPLHYKPSAFLHYHLIFNSFPVAFLNNILQLYFFNIYSFGCSRSSLWHAGSLVVACGIQFLDQGWNMGSLHQEQEVLTTGSPRKAPNCLLISSNSTIRILVRVMNSLHVTKSSNFSMPILLDPSGHFILLVSFLSLWFYSITLPRFSPVSLVTLPSHLHVLLLSDMKYWGHLGLCPPSSFISITESQQIPFIFVTLHICIPQIYRIFIYGKFISPYSYFI